MSGTGRVARDGYVLYVHPYNHVQDALVPMGAVALMNRVTAPKLGLHAHELTPQHIADAAVLCLDLHWYFSVEAVNWIARQAKALRPDLPIVLGGITASFYAPELLERFPLDYVVQGDAEYTFPRLIEALLDGREVPALPNLYRRGGQTPERRKLTADEYAENDYLTFDWFPSLEKHTFAMHDECGVRPFWEEMDRYHPYVPLNRGCVFPCASCFGSYQSVAFGNGQVNRSIAAVEASLDRIEAHPRLRFVTFTGGTESVERIGMYREVFQRRRQLGAYVMHFCDLPTDDQLKMYLDAFDRVVMDFTNPVEIRMPLAASGWTTSAAEARIEQILSMLDGEPRARVGLSSVHGDATGFLAKMGDRAFETIRLKNASEWALPAPNKFQLPMLRPANQAAAVVHQAAKAEQLEGFRAVSGFHANVALAYAVAPALRPLLNEPLPYDDHVEGRGDLSLEAPCAQPFRAAFRAEYAHWYVTTLRRVDVQLWSVTGPAQPALSAPPVAPSAHPPTAAWSDRSGWQAAGEMNMERTMAGSMLSWEGPWPGGDSLVFAPRLVVNDSYTWTVWEHPEVELLTLPLGQAVDTGLPVRVQVTATQHVVRVEVMPEGRDPITWRWTLDMFSPGGRSELPSPVAKPLLDKLNRWVPKAMGAKWAVSEATEQSGRIFVSLSDGKQDLTLWSERNTEPRGGVVFDRGVEVFSVGEFDASLRPAGERMAAVLARLLCNERAPAQDSSR